MRVACAGCLRLTRFDGATRLAALSLAGQALAYVLGVFLARQLGVDGFETYVVASAAFIVMVTLVPQGLEKYALKLIPPLLDRGEPAQVGAYLRFACRRMLIACAVVGVPVALWAWHAGDLRPATRLALVISCATLPVGSLVHLAMEVLTAFGRPLAATLVFRLVVPATVLALVTGLVVLGAALHGQTAIAAWSAAWCVALALMAWQIRRAAPPGLRSVTAPAATNAWAVQARPFWLYRVALAMLAQAGVFALDRLQPSASVVGAFAAAMSTASIAQVLATATNRVYASQLSRLLDGGDFAAIAALRAARLRWAAWPLAVWAALVCVFARPILSWFRPEFVEEGVLPLRLLAVCVAATTLLSTEPTYFKHRGRGRTLFHLIALAALLQVALLALLVPEHGATGAAIAYAAAVMPLYLGLAWLAQRDLRQPR